MSKGIGLFPGCSLEGTASPFLTSLEFVLRALDIPYKEIRDWNCCGASAAHAVSHNLYLALTLRNLAQAQQQGYDEILAPCAACFHRLACARQELEDSDATRDAVNADTGMNYRGGVAVRNVLDLLANKVGTEQIAARMKRPLSGLRVACYYGCLNTRTPRMECADSREYPMSMDKILRALGAETVDWSYKTECCGASLFVTAQDIVMRLAGRILKDAEASGADCIAVACPMCQNNLDVKQEQVRALCGVKRPLPVLFITQLMGLAFGASEKELKISQGFTPIQWRFPPPQKTAQEAQA